MLLWCWVSSALCVMIILVGFELVIVPNALKGKYNQSLCSNLSNTESPAKRLVIFLVESLREDFVETKWIPRVAVNPGRGVAIAAQTLTRSGAVALFSGHYEDMFKSVPLFGYKSVEDNIFRHVDYTFYFGPDFIKSYFKDSNQWISNTYPASWLDLQGRPDYADDYVMDSIQEMFNKPRHRDMSYRNIFYIHLTSINLAGLAARQGSDYLEKCVNKMSALISRAAGLFEKYYNDSGTSYMILTDHGMTDWGTHGDGSLSEIRSPILMWGNGWAAGPHATIRQVDVCPLMAAVLGVPVPAQSIGVLNKNYLNTTSSSMAYGSMCTAIQLADLCQSTWHHIQQGFLIKHVLPRTMTKCEYKHQMQKFNALMQERNFPAINIAAENLTKASLNCLTNIENFYKTSFLFLLLMSYFAWIFGTVCMLLTAGQGGHCFNSCVGKVVFTLTCAGYIAMTVFSVASVILEQLPKYYIVIIIIPSLAWVMTTLKTTRCLTSLVKTNQLTLFILFISVIAMSEFTYWAKYYPYTFGAYQVLYAGLLIVVNNRYVPAHVTALWIISSLALTFAPLLPVIALPESAVILNVSSALWITGSCFFSYALNLNAKQCMITIAMASIICLATWIIDLTYLGTNLVLKILAWTVLPLPVFTLLASNILAERLLQVVVSLVGPYLLLSTRHEPIVLLVVTINLYCWLRLEASAPQYEGQAFIRGLTLYYYCQFAVFASGNVPYLSSYDVTWTRLFTTILDKWVMGVLIIYKLTIFLIIVLCFFSATCFYVGTGVKQMILVATLISAISSVRHSLGIILFNNPTMSLPEFFLGNILFLITVLPFTIAPLLVNVKNKIK